MLANRPALAEGHFPLTERPGLGWELDKGFIERYRADR
jgi:D-galactarolactone cycloisomerase